MNMSLRAKIIGIGLMGSAVVIITSVIALVLAVRQEHLLDESITINEALSNHQQCDMMHDALRGDMLSLELADTPEIMKIAHNDAKEHADIFRNMLAANKALSLPAEVRATLEKATPAAEGYLQKIEAIFALATTDRRAALALMPEFNSAFEKAEEQLGKVTEEIVTHSNATRIMSKRSIKLSEITLVAVGSVGVVGVLWLSWILSGRILRTIQATQRVLEKMSTGDFTARVGMKGSDEIASMGQSLDRMGNAVEEVLRGVSQRASALAESANSLTTTSNSLVVGAEETSQQAGAAASAAEEVSSNVATVSAAATEMTASIQEIAKNTGSAARTAGECLALVRKFSETIQRLDHSSGQIGEVVKAISGVAEQTNLLALNATIEAARAGEAGRGFAVVAGEVKSLSQQTSQSTTNISANVNAIQNDARACVEAITHMAHIIEQINQAATTIASAVEEQTATTSEISRIIQRSAENGMQILHAATAVSNASQTTTKGSHLVKESSQELVRLSGSLRDLISGMRFQANAPTTVQP
jgi:methyl-accepting chemotaxis protein